MWFSLSWYFHLITLSVKILFMAVFFLDNSEYNIDTGQYSTTLPEAIRDKIKGTSLLIRQLLPDNLSYTLVDLSLVPPGVLSGSMIYTPKGLTGLLKECRFFAPLSGQVTEYSLTKPENHELLTAVVFFYLNLISYPTDLMSLWLAETGVVKDTADRVAEAIFMCRTEKEESACLSDKFFSKVKQGSSTCTLCKNRLIQPADISEISGTEGSTLVYDLLTFHRIADMHKGGKYLLLDRLPETGFIIQDHRHLVLGLSITLLELSGVTESVLPELFNLILRKTVLWERSLLSLGSFIQLTGAEFAESISKNAVAASLVIGHGHGQYLPLPLADTAPDYTLHKPINAGIPVYLILEFR